jgi:hypothetical protein
VDDDDEPSLAERLAQLEVRKERSLLEASPQRPSFLFSRLLTSGLSQKCQDTAHIPNSPLWTGSFVGPGSDGRVGVYPNLTAWSNAAKAISRQNFDEPIAEFLDFSTRACHPEVLNARQTIIKQSAGCMFDAGFGSSMLTLKYVGINKIVQHCGKFAVGSVPVQGNPDEPGGQSNFLQLHDTHPSWLQKNTTYITKKVTSGSVRPTPWSPSRLRTTPA